ncbi:hypothetical protein ACQKWADRAFT_127938 [Trichoderma austrokoningii]
MSFSVQPPVNVTQELLADKELIQSLGTHPELWLAVMNAPPLSAIGPLSENVAGQYYYLTTPIQQNLSSSSLHDEPAAPDNFISGQDSANILEPQLPNTESFVWNRINNTHNYNIWRRKNFRGYKAMKTTFALLFTCLAALRDGRRAAGRLGYKQTDFLREMAEANCRGGELWLLERGNSERSITLESSGSRKRKQHQVCLYRKAAN